MDSWKFLLVAVSIVGMWGGFLWGEEELLDDLRYRSIEEVMIPASLEPRSYPARLWVPDNEDGGGEGSALVVVLHTWSGNYKQDQFSGGPTPGILSVLNACEERGWHMVMPDFGGPNIRPEACASPEAIQNVIDTVHFMKSRYTIHPDRVFLFGVSGGGHMALMMAGKYPHLWSGVSAWVPISDLAQWHGECVQSGRKYAQHLEAVTGGVPGESEKIDQQYRERSPIHFLSNPELADLPLEINAGIRDGHDGSVPVSHTLKAFNTIARATGHSTMCFTPNQIQIITDTASVPESLVFQQAQPEWRSRDILVFRKAGATSVCLFNGGHEGDIPAAFHFFDRSPASPRVE